MTHKAPTPAPSGNVPNMPEPPPPPRPKKPEPPPNEVIRDGCLYPPAVTEPPPDPPAPPPPPGEQLRQDFNTVAEWYTHLIKAYERLEKRVDKLEKAGAGLAVEDPRNWEDDAD